MKKPSITELTGLLDKPALLKWANTIGLQGIDLDLYRATSKKNGISYHKKIEDYLLNGIEIDDVIFKNNCIDFFSDKNILEVEKKLENDFFTGRLDIKFEYHGLIYIGDFKTNQNRIYLENKLQLSGYRMIEGCDKVCIISLPDFNIVPIDNINYGSCEKILINLSNIYNLKNTI